MLKKKNKTKQPSHIRRSVQSFSKNHRLSIRSLEARDLPPHSYWTKWHGWTRKKKKKIQFPLNTLKVCWATALEQWRIIAFPAGTSRINSSFKIVTTARSSVERLDANFIFSPIFKFSGIHWMINAWKHFRESDCNLIIGIIKLNWNYSKVVEYTIRSEVTNLILLDVSRAYALRSNVNFSVRNWLIFLFILTNIVILETNWDRRKWIP